MHHNQVAASCRQGECLEQGLLQVHGPTRHAAARL